MNQSHKSVDMLEGKLVPALTRFAMPIALSSILQQLFNSADTLVVGRFANANALAAVGTNGEIVAFFVALSTGLSVGANVIAASAIGAGKRKSLYGISKTSLIVALMSGLCLAFVGLFLAAPVLRLIETPDEILDAATLYLKLYLIGYPFLMLYNFGAALLRADGDSIRPFRILVFSGILNVVLNLFFVITFKMGVVGVAVATDMSSVVSALLVLRLLRRETAEMEKGSVSRKFVGKILRIGVPAGLQGAVFCFANIFVQAAVNSFGAEAVAGSTISMNFEYIAYFMVTAFGQAVTTFVSQNHAAGNDKRCRTIMRNGLLLSILFSAVICVPVIIFRHPIARLFTSEAEVIRIAGVRIWMILLLQSFCGFFEIPAGFLRGMGHSALPAAEMTSGICLFRVIWILTVFQRNHTMESLFICFPVSWGVTSALLLVSVLHFMRVGIKDDYMIPW